MMKKFFKEFKEFAIKGNVIDMAVGVIIGGAFGKIVTSLVNDIIMPVIGKLVGNIEFSDLKIIIQYPSATQEEVAIRYGAFITQFIDFIIIAFCIFLMVKMINLLKRKKEVAQEVVEAKEPEPTKEEILLTEIRDILKKADK